MIKVFLKIPGVQRPVSVVGRPTFEDERYLVLSDNVVRKKILWENILYIEELKAPAEELPEVEEPVAKKPAPAAPPTNEKVDLMVSFTGAISNMYRIEGVSAGLVSESKWTPDLAQLIFTNKSVKTILGKFIVTDVKVEGHNVTITTKEEHSKPAPAADLLSKADVLQDLVKKGMQFGSPPPLNRPSMKMPTDFSMTMSPLEGPISLKPNTTSVNDDTRYREEEAAGEGSDNR